MIPTVFSTRSAQFFAEGGVRLLDCLGIVDTLAFGSECADPETLARLAGEIDSNQQSSVLKSGLKKGKSYAAAIAKTSGSETDIMQPNVILAIEYLRAIRRFHADFSPLPLPRFYAGHHDPVIPSKFEFPVASASAIRASLANGDEYGALRAVPKDVGTMLSNTHAYGFADMNHLFRPLLVKLLTVPPEAIRSILGINEGIEHRIRRAALSSHTYGEIVEAVRSKRYPRAHVQRLLLHILLSLQKETVGNFDVAGPLYARVLAFDDTGRHMLRAVMRRGKIPVVTKLSKFISARALETEQLSPAQKMIAFDLRATSLASLTSNPVGHPPAYADFLTSPIYLQT